MDSERYAELEARLIVMELMLLGLTRSLSRKAPGLASDVLRELRDQQARLDLSTPRAEPIVRALTQSIEAVEQILAQKPQ